MNSKNLQILQLCPQDYIINFYWDMDTQALGSKPF